MKMPKKKAKKENPVGELEKNDILLSSRIDEVTNKLNEVVAVLKDNGLSRKLEVDFIYSEKENEEPKGEEELEEILETEEDDEDDEETPELPTEEPGEDEEEEDEDDLEEIEEATPEPPKTPSKKD